MFCPKTSRIINGQLAMLAGMLTGWMLAAANRGATTDPFSLTFFCDLTTKTCLTDEMKHSLYYSCVFNPSISSIPNRSES